MAQANSPSLLTNTAGSGWQWPLVDLTKEDDQALDAFVAGLGTIDPIRPESPSTAMLRNIFDEIFRMKDQLLTIRQVQEEDSRKHLQAMFELKRDLWSYNMDVHSKFFLSLVFWLKKVCNFHI